MKGGSHNLYHKGHGFTTKFHLRTVVLIFPSLEVVQAFFCTVYLILQSSRGVIFSDRRAESRRFETNCSRIDK
jgi:hypothetical protein